MQIDTKFWEREEWQEKAHKLHFTLFIFFTANLCYGIYNSNIIISGVNIMPCMVLFLEWRSYIKWSKSKKKTSKR